MIETGLGLRPSILESIYIEDLRDIFDECDHDWLISAQRPFVELQIDLDAKYGNDTQDVMKQRHEQLASQPRYFVTSRHYSKDAIIVKRITWWDDPDKMFPPMTQQRMIPKSAAGSEVEKVELWRKRTQVEKKGHMQINITTYDSSYYEELSKIIQAGEINK
jgi:hypothetical protein